MSTSLLVLRPRAEVPRQVATRVHVAQGAPDGEGRRAAGATRSNHDEEGAPGWGALPELSLVAAGGVLIIAVGYALGRHSMSGGVPLYWLGEVVMVLPLAIRLLSRRLEGRNEALGLVAVLGITTYLVKVSYSPLAFKFPDELQHWRTTQTILQTGQLFHINHSLPVSPAYPGLEIFTSGLSQLTGLSVFQSGLVVSGVAHLMVIVGIYLLFLEVSGSFRMAGVGALAYALEPHFQSFESQYTYQLFGLLFLVLSILAVCHLTKYRPAGRGWWACAIACIAMTVVTHHVGSYALLFSLVVVTLAHMVRPTSYGRDWRPAILTGLCASMIAIWLGLVSPRTVTYLSPALQSVLKPLAGLFGAGGTIPVPGGPAGPSLDRWLGYASVLAVLVGLTVGWRRLWRYGGPWALALGAGASSYLVLLVARLVAAGGAGLSGRAFTYVYLPLGFVLALAVVDTGSGTLWIERFPDNVHWRAVARTLRLPLLGALAALLFLGGIAIGWPPYWERVPGPYVPGGFERSVGPRSVAAATWANEVLGPGHRIAGPFMDFILMGTYGDQDPVQGVAQLFYAKTFTKSTAALVQSESLQYAVVDKRLTTALPASGSYFPSDPGNGPTQPLPEAALRKFDTVAGVSRVYDNGDIRVYDLAGSRYEP